MSGLEMVLMLPEKEAAYRTIVPPQALRRIARYLQHAAAGISHSAPCQAWMGWVPRRGSPAFAEALQVHLSSGPAACVWELPVSAFEPLLAVPAAAVRRAAGAPADTPLTYGALTPKDDPQAPLWSGTLPPFSALVRAPDAGLIGRALDAELSSCADIPVRIGAGAARDCVAYCRDGEIEKGGALLGYLHRSPDGAAPGLRLEVVAFAPAEGAEASSHSLTFSGPAWEAIERRRVAFEKDAGLADPLQIVGWAHGHPRLGAAGGTPFFLSYHDQAIMEQHFNEPFDIALVVDAGSQTEAPLEETLAVFGWDRHGIRLVRRSIDVCEPEAAQSAAAVPEEV
jgi:hypothetical protein